MNKSGHVVHGWIKIAGSDYLASAIKAIVQEYMTEEGVWDANISSGLLSSGILSVRKQHIVKRMSKHETKKTCAAHISFHAFSKVVSMLEGCMQITVLEILL